MADVDHVIVALWLDSAKLRFCGFHKVVDDVKEAMRLLRSQQEEIKNLKDRLAERDCEVPNFATCPGWREGER